MIGREGKGWEEEAFVPLEERIAGLCSVAGGCTQARLVSHSGRAGSVCVCVWHLKTNGSASPPSCTRPVRMDDPRKATEVALNTNQRKP